MGYDVILSNAPPGTKIPNADLNSLLALLRPRLSTQPSEGDDDLPFIFGAATPGANDRGKLWFRKTNNTTSGILIGTYAYLNGKWCKSYGSDAVGSLKLFNGDPTAFFHPTTGYGLFNSSTPEVANDWYGWRLLIEGGYGMDFPGRLLMSANKWDSTQNKWLAKKPDGSYLDLSTLVPAGITLAPENIPSLNVDVTLNGYEEERDENKNGSGSATDRRPIVSEQWNGANGGPFTPNAANKPTAKYTNPNDGETPTTIPYTMPPFKAAPLALFVGYTYTDPSTQ